MRTTRSLTVSHSICHTCSPCHTCPLAMHAPPPTMHPHPTTHAPCHACPSTVPAPLPCKTPSTTHAPPHHACPLPCTHPTTHAPPPCIPPCHPCPPTPLPHGQNSWHMLLKILPCPNFVAGGKYKWTKEFRRTLRTQKQHTRLWTCHLQFFRPSFSQSTWAWKVSSFYLWRVRTWLLLRWVVWVRLLSQARDQGEDRQGSVHGAVNTINDDNNVIEFKGDTPKYKIHVPKVSFLEGTQSCKLTATTCTYMLKPLATSNTTELWGSHYVNNHWNRNGSSQSASKLYIMIFFFNLEGKWGDHKALNLRKFNCFYLQD